MGTDACSPVGPRPPRLSKKLPPVGIPPIASWRPLTMRRRELSSSASRGRGKTAAVLLRSVAYKVLHLAELPVLVIP